MKSKKGLTLRKLGNKGYFFIIDAFIGSTIIFLALIIILNSGIKPTSVQYNYQLAEDYTSFIMDTQIKDINNNLITQMTGRIINNTDYTIVETVDNLYNNGDLSDAGMIVQNITEPLIPQKYGFSYNLIVNGVTTNIYNRSTIPIENANIVIASRKITFLTINSTKMFGPALLEVKIWI